jgi:hypothetical protein
MCIYVLSIQSVRDVVMLIDLVDNPIGVVLGGRSKYHNFVVLRHLPQELLCPRSHQELALVLALRLARSLTSE